MSIVFRSRCCQTTDHQLRPSNGTHAAALHCRCGARIRWVKRHQLGTFGRQYGQQQPEQEQQFELMGVTCDSR